MVEVTYIDDSQDFSPKERTKDNSLQLSHFDTKTKVSLPIEERIDNCIANYLFPDATFSVGHMDLKTVEVEDLQPHNGESLQFSSGKRLYYSSENVGEQLYPKASDRAAYGSLPFTPVQELLNLQQARVLVIDDETGNSGGVIPDKDFAKELVGDCYGKMSYELSQELTGKYNTPIQFRLGIRAQEGNDVPRIAKGTLAPDARLMAIGSNYRDRGVRVDGDPDVIRDLNLGDYDLVLATSMFKGRKGEQAIAPGSYKLDVGLGLKTEAEYGKQKLGVQVLVNYPKGVASDVLPVVKEEAAELAKSLATPHQLAQSFIEYYERKEELKETLDADGKLFSPLFDSFESQSNQLASEEALYKMLKTDMENHGQLLEHPYVVDELKGYVQSRWKELGFSGGLKVKSALAQPTQKLGKDEICAPNLPDGADVIVTRSPLVNSNGVIILKNRHIPELNRLEGCIHINPETAAKHLQADFDGDRLAYEDAAKYPTLAKEIKEKLLPENRYPDIVKRDKIPYKGSFEQIAIQCAEDQIGWISNQIMISAAISNDTLNRPEEEKPKLIAQAGYHYQRLMYKAEKTKVELPQEYIQPMKQLVSLYRKSKQGLEPQEVEQGMEAIRGIQKQAVADLGNELQVAVDGPKSASRPDMDKFAMVQSIGKCINVEFMRERKSREVFLEYPAPSNTYSPIDMMLKEVNEAYSSSTLAITPRPTHTFRELFPKPPQEYIDLAKDIRDVYNVKLKIAMSLDEQLNGAPEFSQPHVMLDPSNTPSFAVTNLQIPVEGLGDKPFEAVIKDTPQELNLANKKSVFIKQEGAEEPKMLGTISLEDSDSLGLVVAKDNYPLTQCETQVVPGVTEKAVEAAWEDLNNFVGKVQEEYAPEERPLIAQGMWHAAHSRTEYQTKKALAPFRIYPEECAKNLEELHNPEMKVVGLQYDTNKHKGQDLTGQTLHCEVVEQEIPSKDGPRVVRGIAVEGQFLGPIQQESNSLPLETVFKAEFQPEPPAKATVTLPDGTALNVGKVRDNNFKETIFTGSEQKIKITPGKDKYKKPTYTVSIGDKTLGQLDKKSNTTYEACLRSRKREQALVMPLEANAKIESPPSSTGTITVDPESTVYPWQMEQRNIKVTAETTKEIEVNNPIPKATNLDNQRRLLRARYDQYSVQAEQVWGKQAPGTATDIDVAKIALMRGESRDAVMRIMSQSPTITSKRPDENSPDFDKYREVATKFIENVCDDAQKYVERFKGRSQGIQR